MTSLRTSSRAAALVAIGLGASFWVACSDRSADLPTGPTARPVFAAPDPHGIRAAVAAHERHTPALMRIPGVVGTAVGLLPDGKAAVTIFLARPDVRGLPRVLDGVPVAAQVTGQFIAFSDPTTRQRPAPPGFSVGHPDITAGMAIAITPVTCRTAPMLRPRRRLRMATTARRRHRFPALPPLEAKSSAICTAPKSARP